GGGASPLRPRRVCLRRHARLSVRGRASGSRVPPDPVERPVRGVGAAAVRRAGRPRDPERLRRLAGAPLPALPPPAAFPEGDRGRPRPGRGNAPPAPRPTPPRHPPAPPPT